MRVAGSAFGTRLERRVGLRFGDVGREALVGEAHEDQSVDVLVGVGLDLRHLAADVMAGQDDL